MKISAQQLEDFAAKEPAKGLLPELVRRLIQASADGLGDVRFPSGESTFRPGADGLLQAMGSPPYVPPGVSLWELSTEKQPHQKAKDDIEKRSKSEARDAYLDHKRADITYVAYPFAVGMARRVRIETSSRTTIEDVAFGKTSKSSTQTI